MEINHNLSNSNVKISSVAFCTWHNFLCIYYTYRFIQRHTGWDNFNEITLYVYYAYSHSSVCSWDLPILLILNIHTLNGCMNFHIMDVPMFKYISHFWQTLRLFENFVLTIINLSYSHLCTYASFPEENCLVEFIDFLNYW